MSEKTFERGNDRLKRLQQLPGMAEAIAEEKERSAEGTASTR